MTLVKRCSLASCEAIDQRGGNEQNWTSDGCLNALVLGNRKILQVLKPKVHQVVILVSDIIFSSFLIIWH